MHRHRETELNPKTYHGHFVFGLRRWFGVVDSSCWFVDVHCRWFQFSSDEPMLTEISTVTGANNLIVNDKPWDHRHLLTSLLNNKWTSAGRRPKTGIPVQVG
jgi:hypothetical protein